MIARIVGPDGGAEYVALHLDERTRARDVWVPVRGDRGARGEASELEAVKVCVREVQAQMGPLVEDARRMHRLWDIRGREPSDNEKRRMWEVTRSVSESLEWLGGNVARLMDEPSTEDEVDIDAEYAAVEPTRPDDELEQADEPSRPGDEVDLEHLAVQLKRILKRNEPNRTILLRCLEEYPALAPLLAGFVDKIVAAGMRPDEISAVISMQRKDPSLLALLVGLLAMLAAE